MPDREKVIKALDICSDMDGNHLCDECPYDIKSAKCIFLLHSVSLKLLKEQQEQIDDLKQTAQSMMEGIVVSQPQIVRCRDCKHGVPSSDGLMLCNKGVYFDRYKNADWYCADGERKEGR